MKMAHVKMAAARAAPEGDHWTEHADSYEATSTGWQALIQPARSWPEHKILDIGCGTGKVTRDPARMVPSGAVTALGVGLSAKMPERAGRGARPAILNRPSAHVREGTCSPR